MSQIHRPLTVNPAEFSFLARALIGPADGPGEESVDVTACTPEWLATAWHRARGAYPARHHLVVAFDKFDLRQVRSWLEHQVNAIEADSWVEIGERLGRIGLWEFEKYTSRAVPGTGAGKT